LAGSVSASATTLTLVSGSGYPTGTGGPFVLVLDPGTPLEEKVLCASLSGATVTVAAGGRGWDGTTASAHSSGAGNVAQVFSAAEADDDNAHVYDTTRNDHPQYLRVADTGWLALSLGANVAGFGGYRAPPAYRVVNGWVYLDALIGINPGVAANAILATLPVGARSPYLAIFSTVYSIGAGDTSGRLNVGADGTVSMPLAIPAGSYVSLSGIVFANT
jgi:hypothetical protein